MAACGASGAGLDGTLGAGLLGIDGFATGLLGGMGGPRGLLGPGEDGLKKRNKTDATKERVRKQNSQEAIERKIVN